MIKKFISMMERLISQKRAVNTMIALLAVVLVFHILVLTGAIPHTIVWAGKISSLREMRLLEMISVGINSFMILIFLLRANYIQSRIPVIIVNKIIWLLAMLFILNTIGNLFATSRFELYFFTPLTFISAILCLRIVIGGRRK